MLIIFLNNFTKLVILLQPSSDLVGLIQVLSVVFSENAPLYAKSVGSNPAYSPQPTKRQAPVLQSSK